MVPGCPGTCKKISTLVLVHIVRSVFLLLGLLAWFPTPTMCSADSLVPFVYTCTAYLFFGLYTSTLCEVLCEVPFLSCDLLLCVGDGGGGGGGGCVAAGSGTTPEPRRATPLVRVNGKALEGRWQQVLDQKSESNCRSSPSLLFDL